MRLLIVFILSSSIVNGQSYSHPFKEQQNGYLIYVDGYKTYFAPVEKIKQRKDLYHNLFKVDTILVFPVASIMEELPYSYDNVNQIDKGEQFYIHTLLANDQSLKDSIEVKVLPVSVDFVIVNSNANKCDECNEYEIFSKSGKRTRIIDEQGLYYIGKLWGHIELGEKKFCKKRRDNPSP